MTIPRHDDAPAREASLQVRFATLHWQPPSHHKQRKELAPIAVQVVLATETPAPAKGKPIRWPPAGHHAASDHAGRNMHCRSCIGTHCAG